MSDSSAIAGGHIVSEIEQPIGDDDPCGVDVTYDDAFQQIKEIIDTGAAVGGRIDQEKALLGGEESIVSSAGGVNYERIVELSREILQSKSKDIRVMCYLALGLFHTRGMGGMAEGLTGLDRLTQTYWEDMYPAKRRARARSSAVKFLTDRLDDTLKEYQPTVDDRESLEQSLDVLGSLQTFLLDELEDNAPALSSFKKTLTAVLRRVPESTGDAEAETGTSNDSVPAAGDDAGEQPDRRDAGQKAGGVEQGSRTAGTEAGFEGTNDAHIAILQAAAFLYERDRTSTIPYRLSRAVRWEILRSEPSHENGQTNIPPPEERRRRHLEDLHEKGQHAALLKEAELLLHEPPFHFWLDLQRMVTAGMEALGPSYRAPREIVLEETALLVRRLPKLPELRFNDGTPFADALTREWLDLEADSVRAVASDESANGTRSTDEDHLAASFKEARGRLTRGDLSAALKIMNDGARDDRSKKDRFLRQRYVASLCMKGGQPMVARPIFEQLEADIRRHGLDEWEPRLALEVWTDLYNCYDALAGGSAAVDKQMIRERAAELFERICTVDPDFAVILRNR